MPATDKQAEFDDHLRVRFTKSLRRRLAVLAKLAKRTPSDFIRIILEDYADNEERRLGIVSNGKRREPKTQVSTLRQKQTGN